MRTFPSRAGKWQVSNSGGSHPVWSRDGKELYFIGADQKMMASQVKEDSTFEASVPKPLFDTHMAANAFFDVGKDGRFLIPMQIEETERTAITVVINWQAKLKK